MTLFPTRADWDQARTGAGLDSTGHDDMHAGAWKSLILSAVWPDAVRPGAYATDNFAPDRSMLLVHGMTAYTHSGVIGQPSAATSEKGELVLDSLADSFARHLEALGLPPAAQSSQGVDQER